MTAALSLEVSWSPVHVCMNMIWSGLHVCMDMIMIWALEYSEGVSGVESTRYCATNSGASDFSPPWSALRRMGRVHTTACRFEGQVGATTLPGLLDRLTRTGGTTHSWDATWRKVALSALSSCSCP